MKLLLLATFKPLETLKTQYKAEKWPEFIGVCFYILTLWVIIALLIFLFLGKMGGLLGAIYSNNQKQIDNAVLIIICIVGAIYYLKHRKKAAPNITAVATAVDPEMAQYEYEVLRKVLFNILLEVGDVVGLKIPNALSELDTPNRYTGQGGITFYNFIATKKGDVDPGVARQIIQNRISQMLNAMEIPGITQATFLYEGAAHPCIMVHNVSQTGVLVQIDLVFVNKSYCEYLRNRRYQQLENAQYKNSARDKDF